MVSAKGHTENMAMDLSVLTSHIQPRLTPSLQTAGSDSTSLLSSPSQGYHQPHQTGSSNCPSWGTGRKPSPSASLFLF